MVGISAAVGSAIMYLRNWFWWCRVRVPGGMGGFENPTPLPPDAPRWKRSAKIFEKTDFGFWGALQVFQNLRNPENKSYRKGFWKILLVLYLNYTLKIIKRA